TGDPTFVGSLGGLSEGDYFSFNGTQTIRMTSMNFGGHWSDSVAQYTFLAIAAFKNTDDSLYFANCGALGFVTMDNEDNKLAFANIGGGGEALNFFIVDSGAYTQDAIQLLWAAADNNAGSNTSW